MTRAERPLPELPMTSANADQFYEAVFAPWVRAQGHEIVSVEEGHVVTRLPQDPAQQFFAGVLCGQALMSAIDTAMSMAVFTLEGSSVRGTASQSTRFLRPAGGQPMLVEATIVKSGRTAVYGEVHVRGEDNGKLVAHATCEFL